MTFSYCFLLQPQASNTALIGHEALITMPDITTTKYVNIFFLRYFDIKPFQYLNCCLILFVVGSYSVKLLEPSDCVWRTWVLWFGLQTHSVGKKLLKKHMTIITR